MEVETVLGDTAYSGKENLEFAKDNFELAAKLNPNITQGKKNDGKNQTDTYYFDVEKCKHCPLRDGCYKDGAKSKTYSVTIKQDIHKEHELFQQTDDFKDKARERYKIEAKNSELKCHHGYGVESYSGLISMQLQGAVTIFIVNIKRILKLAAE